MLVAVQPIPRAPGKESVTLSQSKPSVAAIVMKGARRRNGHHSWVKQDAFIES